MTDAFGIVAMVAMTPLITIQILGLVYQIRSGRTGKAAVRMEPQAAFALLPEDEIIEL